MADSDPGRTLRLLWRREGGTPRRRGPRQSLTIDQIVDAAVAIADAEGLDALTMRRVATDLGVVPMSLYTYVPGKTELLDLMLDAVYARMSRAVPGGGHWRDRLTAIADDNYALYRLHPWITVAAPTRPVLGPGLMGKYEYELHALEGLGLDDVTMDAALTYLLGFVETAARQALRAAQRSAEMSDAQWWEANAPLLAEVLDPTAYPVASRVGTAAGEAMNTAYSPDHAYAFGLQRTLDGLAALLPEDP